MGSATALRRRATDRSGPGPRRRPVPPGSDGDEAGNLQVHARAENRQGTKRIGCCPPSTLARISGRRSRKMSQPCGINSSNDRPRSYCATTWRPASSMTGSACCHVSSTGAQTASRSSRYDRRSAGDSRQSAKAVEIYPAVVGRLRGHLQVERDRGDRLLEGGPQHVRIGDAHRVGVLGEHLHLGEAGLLFGADRSRRCGRGLRGLPVPRTSRPGSDTGPASKGGRPHGGARKGRRPRKPTR